MRIGFNPQKDKQLEPNDFFHQVVIPVYIPNFEGYFEDSFQIFQYCLESLFKTCHNKTYFSVINNGSCPAVVEYLNELYRTGKIHEVLHTTSIGKLNAILKGISGQNFPLVTITDADVLFLDDWQKATYDVFDAFPKAGVVSPSSNPKMLRYYTANVIGNHLFSRKLYFTSVEDVEAMRAFAKSIDNPALFKQVHFEKQLTVQNSDSAAIIGAGHFVATYRGVCFNTLSDRYSEYSLGGDSEESLLDKPPVKLDLWRLSTLKSYVFHMGNVKEDWMKAVLLSLQDNEKSSAPPQLKTIKNFKLVTWFKTEVFSRIIFRKPIWRLFLRYKGLSKEEASMY